jgi:hypothetical protein
VTRYRHLAVKKVKLKDYVPVKKARELTPRQKAQLERDEELKKTFDEAAALPQSEAVVIEIRPDQKLPTIGAAITKLLKAEPRDLNWGIRGNAILISRGPIPGGRRPRKR